MNHIIDISDIPLKDAYSRIFEQFDQAELNEAVVLKTNHDPKSLYFRFLFERTGQFSWDKTEAAEGGFVISILRIA